MKAKNCFSSLKLRFTFCLLAAFAPLGGLHAQATRTWVSGVGDDANPCSRTAPGKTFAGAISKTAAGGEISVLDPGGFGAVTITKSITINGDGTLSGILASGTNGVVINAGATDVVILRNISIKSPGGGLTAPSGVYGVKILQAGTVIIDSCVIQDGTDFGVNIAPTASAVKVFIKNSTILNCQGGGVRSTPPTGVTVAVDITNSSILGCKVGLRADPGSRVSASGSVINGSTANGVVASGASTIALTQCRISQSALNGINCGVGATGSLVILNDCTVFGNSVGLNALSGSSITSLGNNMVAGNTADGTPTSVVAAK